MLCFQYFYNVTMLDCCSYLQEESKFFKFLNYFKLELLTRKMLRLNHCLTDKRLIFVYKFIIGL